jgi:hypothetical protein
METGNESSDIMKWLALYLKEFTALNSVNFLEVNMHVSCILTEAYVCVCVCVCVYVCVQKFNRSVYPHIHG